MGEIIDFSEACDTWNCVKVKDWLDEVQALINYKEGGHLLSALWEGNNRIEAFRKDLMSTIPKKHLNENTKYHLNLCGNFVIGGSTGDVGRRGGR